MTDKKMTLKFRNTDVLDTKVQDRVNEQIHDFVVMGLMGYVMEIDYNSDRYTDDEIKSIALHKMMRALSRLIKDSSLKLNTLIDLSTEIY